MTLVQKFLDNRSAVSMWATVLLSDGMIFEGLIVSEANYGIYLSIGGDSGRLSLFPWDKVSRIVYSESTSL